MAITVRPPVEADLAALTRIDALYAERHELEPMLTAGSLRFSGRTEHSFVAEDLAASGGEPLGFVMAQAVWSGERPQVLVARVATADPAAAEALVKALVKSAYDSGVYDLLTRTARSDAALLKVLEQESFFEDRLVQHVRVLGSRGVKLADEVADKVAAPSGAARADEGAAEVSRRG